jgi:hypothetical protein
MFLKKHGKRRSRKEKKGIQKPSYRPQNPPAVKKGFCIQLNPRVGEK